MINFDYIKGENAFTYQDFYIPLNNQGLVSMRGPNGYGKSVPWEILYHIFFEKTSRGAKLDDIVLKDNYLGETAFWRGADYFKVLQFRKHKKFGGRSGSKVFKNDEDITLDDIHEQRKLVRGLLGISENEFMNGIYLSQNSIHTLIRGKPAERKVYLTNLFEKLLILDQIHELAGKELKISNTEHKELIAKVAEAENIQEMIDQLGNVEELETKYDNFQERLTSLKDKSQRVFQKIKNIEKQKAQLEQKQALEIQAEELEQYGDTSKLKDIEKKLNTCRVRLEKIEANKENKEEFLELQSELEEYPDLSGKDAGSIQTKLETQTEKLSTLKQNREDETKRRSVVAALDVLHKKLKKGTRTEQEVMEDKINAKTDLKNLKAELKDLEELDHPECPLCGHELDQESIQEKIEKLRTKKDVLTQNLDEFSSELEDAQEQGLVRRDIEKAEDKIKDLNKCDLEEVEEAITSLGDKIQKNKEILRQLSEIQKLEVKMAELKYEEYDESELEELKETEQTLSKQVRKLQKLQILQGQIAEFPEIDEEAFSHVKELDQRYTKLQGKIEILTEQSAVVADQWERYQGYRKGLTALKPFIQRHDVVRDEIIVLEAIEKAYGPKGLKLQKLHQIVLSIVERLPTYTSQLFDNMEFVTDPDIEKFDKNLGIYAKRKVGKSYIYYDVRSLSGGEGKRFSTALVFAIRDLLDASKLANLLILDEIDTGLDESGAYSFSSSFLPSIQKEKDQTIIVISHQPSVLGASYDRIWEATMQKNISVLKGVQEC